MNRGDSEGRFRTLQFCDFKTALEQGDFASGLSDLGLSDLNLLHKAWQVSKVHREVVTGLALNTQNGPAHFYITK